MDSGRKADARVMRRQAPAVCLLTIEQKAATAVPRRGISGTSPAFVHHSASNKAMPTSRSQTAA